MKQNNTNSAFTLPCNYSSQKFTLGISASTQAKFIVEKKTASRRPAETITELDTAPARLIHLRDGDVVLWISANANLPNLSVKGEQGRVRAAFTDSEVQRIRDHLATWYEHEKGDTSEMRSLLRNLVDVLKLTGMQQSTESMNLQRKHMAWHIVSGALYLRLWVKGKTGERWLIAKHECVNALKGLKSSQIDIAHFTFNQLIESQVAEKVFRFTDGRAPFELKKVFRRLLDELGLVKAQAGSDRTLHSLRNTYATNALLIGKDLHILARQMIISLVMLERHYSKLVAAMTCLANTIKSFIERMAK